MKPEELVKAMEALKEACRSEPGWPIFSLITSTALKTEEHQGQLHQSCRFLPEIKLKNFPASPPGNFWRKEACRSEPSWPIFSLITSTALKTEEHQGQRPFSWSPKVCFTATIPYMAENSTMEIIYTPAFRFAHLWLTSPGGTCNSDEVGLGALQFLERGGYQGKDRPAGF